MATDKDKKGDKYRSHIYGEGEKNTEWRYGAPPNYDIVNKLFEEGKTKVSIIRIISSPASVFRLNWT